MFNYATVIALFICLIVGVMIGLFLGAIFFRVSYRKQNDAFKQSKAKIAEVDAGINRANRRLQRKGRISC